MKLHVKNEVCGAIEKVVREFAGDWQQAPDRWLQEVDVQCDLAYRIKSLLTRLHLEGLSARYSKALFQYKNKGQFSRLACEPYVSCHYEGGKYAHPDIVVWDDSNNQERYINDGSWPILWAAEIKYMFREPKSTDFDRLADMVKAGILYRGLWLRLLVKQKNKIPTEWHADKGVDIFTVTLDEENV